MTSIFFSYEIRDIRMPSRVQEAMQMQVEAERKKRAAILESEGIKTAEINVAEGRKQSKILESGTYQYIFTRFGKQFLDSL